MTIEPIEGNTIHATTKKSDRDTFNDVEGSPFSNPATFIYGTATTASDPYARIVTETTGIGVTVILQKDNDAYTGETLTIKQENGWAYTLEDAGANGSYERTPVANGTYTLYKGGVPTGKTLTVNGFHHWKHPLNSALIMLFVSKKHNKALLIEFRKKQDKIIGRISIFSNIYMIRNRKDER